MMKILLKKQYLVNFLSVIILCLSCEKEVAISNDTIVTDFFTEGQNISRIYLTPGAIDNSNGAYIDLRKGKLYNSSQATELYHELDLAYAYSVRSGNNLLTMDAKNVSFSPIGEEIEHLYPYRNKGELYLYSSSTDNDRKWFLSLHTTESINRGYDSLLNVLSGRSIDDLKPVKRLSNLQKGDIVLYNGVNRKIKSVIYIDKISTSSNGTMDMLIKSNMDQQVNFQKPNLPLKNLGNVADTIEFSVNNPNSEENYIDLIRRKVYKIEDLENDDVSQISFIHTFDGSKQLFYSLRTDFIRTGYSVELYNWMQNLPNRRVMNFGRLDDKPLYTGGYLFENIRNNNVDLKKYGADYTSEITDADTRMPRGVSLAVGMVYRIRDVSNDYWGVLKVLEVDNNLGKCKIALKYAHDE